MARRGRYYLARVHRVGFTDETLCTDLSEPASVLVGDHGWTITGAQNLNDQDGRKYIFGYLTKFKPLGEISVVDVLKHTEVDQTQANLRVAKSPFVYLPEFAGIAFLHVWNDIEKRDFMDRFERVIRKTHDEFFVDCQLKPITDLRTFAQKVSQLDSIEEINAKVIPPNPLFSPLWKSLEQYLRRRQADQVEIKEQAAPSQSLNTKIVEIVTQVLEHGDESVANESVEIGDAALLMAADGYGSGKVTGKSKTVTVVVKTSDTWESFLFTKSPTPADLFSAAHARFDAINRSRGLRH